MYLLFTPGLKLMLKDHQYSDEKSGSPIQCHFSYAWSPFTESPSPDVTDRWIELSERDVGFKHIRLEDVSENLRTRIEAAEGSNAVALIVINDRDNHTLSPELVQSASKGSFPVVVITCQDGKRVKECIVKHGSKPMTAMLQTNSEGKYTLATSPTTALQTKNRTTQGVGSTELSPLKCLFVPGTSYFFLE